MKDLFNSIQELCENILFVPFNELREIELTNWWATMQSTYFQSGLSMLLQNGYNQKLSGDVLFTLQPGVIVYGAKGTTHGSGYTYDTHVPLLFYGNGINQGKSYQSTKVTDIAPTISALLGISFPSGTTGAVIEKVID